MPHPADLTALHREAFALMRDALDVPLAAFNLGGERARETLLQRRADAVLTVASALSRFTFEDMIRDEIEHLRSRISQLPVTYRPVIHGARPLPDDCITCGPGCCAPVLGALGLALLQVTQAVRHPIFQLHDPGTTQIHYRTG